MLGFITTGLPPDKKRLARLGAQPHVWNASEITWFISPYLKTITGVRQPIGQPATRWAVSLGDELDLDLLCFNQFLRHTSGFTSRRWRIRWTIFIHDSDAVPTLLPCVLLPLENVSTRPHARMCTSFIINPTYR